MTKNIKDEINSQINRGMQKFFKEFETKLDARSQDHMSRGRPGTPEKRVSVNTVHT